MDQADDDADDYDYSWDILELASAPERPAKALGAAPPGPHVAG